MSEPRIKAFLTHVSGALSTHTPGQAPDPSKGGVKEAMVTVAVDTHDIAKQYDLLRADVPGASWAQIVNSGAYETLAATLMSTAKDLISGFEPVVVVQVEAGKPPAGGVLVTNQVALEAATAAPNARSLQLHRILPYQLGGSEDGAVALCFVPHQGGPIEVRSLHPSEGEASLAERHLKEQGISKTALIRVHTPVTQLIANIVAGAFVRPQQAATVAAAAVEPAVTASPTPLAPRGAL